MINFGCIKFKDKRFPPQLQEVNKPPSQLFYKGNLGCLDGILLAFVGTRRATAYGKYCAEKLIEELSLCNVVIVSGLANGIDTICHKAALKNGLKTIAVFGTPLDTIFPMENEKMVEEILRNGGLILSEYATGTLMQKYFFPERNRIVAGLSLATVIVEAPEKSGALLTARMALNAGRDVYAVPADIDSKNSIGCNKLIQNSGAKAVMSGADVISDLRLQPSIFSGVFGKNKDSIESALNYDDYVKKVYAVIPATRPISIEKIMNDTGLDLKKINKALSILEINFLIASLATGSYLKTG